MTVTMNLETRQRAFTEWWSEETEYIFQRIEHWAACAKGYNRLRSQKNSPQSNDNERGKFIIIIVPLEYRWQ